MLKIIKIEKIIVYLTLKQILVLTIISYQHNLINGFMKEPSNLLNFHHFMMYLTLVQDSGNALLTV